jgi:hypothetical protein
MATSIRPDRKSQKGSDNGFARQFCWRLCSRWHDEDASRIAVDVPPSATEGHQPPRTNTSTPGPPRATESHLERTRVRQGHQEPPCHQTHGATEDHRATENEDERVPPTSCQQSSTHTCIYVWMQACMCGKMTRKHLGRLFRRCLAFRSIRSNSQSTPMVGVLVLAFG